MNSSAEEAILLLKRWQENSSKLRMVVGTSHVQITLHGTLAKVTPDFIWGHGSAVEEDLKVSLEGATFGFIDDRGIPPELSALGSIVDELLAIAWDNSSLRLTIVKEKS